MFRTKTNNSRLLTPASFVGEMRLTSLAPTGSAETLVRPGWLYANGAAISRVTYKRLFDRIGTTYGVGNGTTTFNLPDYRGRSISCALDGQTAGGNRMTATAGTVGGEENHSLVAAEIPRHVHAKGTLAISGGSHLHGQTITMGANNNPGGNAGTVACAWMNGATGWSGLVRGASASATHTHPSGEIGGATGDGSADSLAGAGHSNIAPVHGCAVMVAF